MISLFSSGVLVFPLLPPRVPSTAPPYHHHHHLLLPHQRFSCSSFTSSFPPPSPPSPAVLLLLLNLVRRHPGLLGRGPHGERGRIPVGDVAEAAAIPVVEGRAEGEAALLRQRLLRRPVHDVEVAHFVLVGGTADGGGCEEGTGGGRKERGKEANKSINKYDKMP